MGVEGNVIEVEKDIFIDILLTKGSRVLRFNSQLNILPEEGLKTKSSHSIVAYSGWYFVYSGERLPNIVIREDNYELQ